MARPTEIVPTRRLVLRPWAVADAPALGAAVNANLDHLRPFMAWIADEPLPPDARRALVTGFRQQWDTGGDRIYGAFLGDAVVGGCGVHRRAGASTREIGYWVHVDHVRRGYATELAAALTDVAFAEERIDTVEIHHDRANVASRAIPARLGFTLVREQRKPPLAPGESGVDCTWAVSRAEWTGGAATRPA